MTLLAMLVATYVVVGLLCMVLCTVLSDWPALDVVMFAVIWPIVLAVVVFTAAVALHQRLRNSAEEVTR